MRPRAHELFSERRARDLYPTPGAGVVKRDPIVATWDTSSISSLETAGKVPMGQGTPPLTDVYLSARKILFDAISGKGAVDPVPDILRENLSGDDRFPCPSWGRICHTLWPPYDNIFPPGCYPKVLRWERPVPESQELRVVQAYAREFVDTVRVHKEEHLADPERVERDVVLSLLRTDTSNPDLLVTEAFLSARRGAIQNGCSPEHVLTHVFKEGPVQFILPRVLDGTFQDKYRGERVSFVFLDDLDELSAPGEPPFWFAQSLADGPSALAYFIAKPSQLVTLVRPAEEDDPWRYWGYFKVETVVLADAHKLVWGIAQ